MRLSIRKAWAYWHGLGQGSEVVETSARTGSCGISDPIPDHKSELKRIKDNFLT